jgi:hypothetical protein
MSAPDSPRATRISRFQLVASLGVIAIPALGWFTQQWSGATTLVVYWFENVAVCLFVIARVAVHRRWNPRYGHFHYPRDLPGGHSRYPGAQPGACT